MNVVGEGEFRTNWEMRIDIYTLMCEIASEKLLLI